MRFCLTIILCFPLITSAQRPGRQQIFAHNDYVGAEPFTKSYQHRVGYIEVDVFLRDGKLLVAHTAREIDETKTLEKLYLAPLTGEVIHRGGFIFEDTTAMLTLMIDLKTDGRETVEALVRKVSQFPMLVSCKTLVIAVSGSVPSPDEWKNIPEFIHFDGRPTILYTEEQLARICLISAGFKDYSSWNGKGEPMRSERDKLLGVIRAVHRMRKPIRFWGTPDSPTAWSTLLSYGVDVINTDDVAGLIGYLEK